MLPNARFLSIEFQSKNYLSSLYCSYINCNTYMYVDEPCKIPAYKMYIHRDTLHRLVENFTSKLKYFILTFFWRVIRH